MVIDQNFQTQLKDVVNSGRMYNITIFGNRSKFSNSALKKAFMKNLPCEMKYDKEWSPKPVTNQNFKLSSKCGRMYNITIFGNRSKFSNSVFKKNIYEKPDT